MIKVLRDPDGVMSQEVKDEVRSLLLSLDVCPEEGVTILLGSVMQLCAETEDPNRALDEATERLGEVTL